MDDVAAPGVLKQRNRRTAMWLMAWILLLVVVSIIVVWFRGQVAVKGF
jgi:hypothetical protein